MYSDESIYEDGCPRCPKDSVDFLLSWEHVKHKAAVAVAGTFSNWTQMEMKFDYGCKNGWVRRIKLDAGKYFYKFVRDGEWILDPTNSYTEVDNDDNQNSVLVISAAGIVTPENS